MSYANGSQAPDDDEAPANDQAPESESEFDPQEYDTMLRLERLESLEDEMRELGVTTLAEVRERIAELHRQLDADENA